MSHKGLPKSVKSNIYNPRTPQENSRRDYETFKIFKETKCALRNLLGIVLHSKSTATKTAPVKSWQKIEQISSPRHYLAQVPFQSLLSERQWRLNRHWTCSVFIKRDFRCGIQSLPQKLDSMDLNGSTVIQTFFPIRTFSAESLSL